jgi:hypothetical protein
VLRVVSPLIAGVAVGCAPMGGLSISTARQTCGSVYTQENPRVVLNCYLAHLDSQPAYMRGRDADLYRALWLQQLAVVERWEHRTIGEVDARAQLAALESQTQTQLLQRRSARDAADAGRDAANAAARPKRTECIRTGISVECETR